MPLITTLSGLLSEFPAPVADALARYRHQVFIEKLGWPLPVCNGSESDQFDRPDTVYVIARDGSGRICGCARLLPTLQPYLLADVFPSMFDDGPMPHSATVWELSRFASTAPRCTRRMLAATVARAAREGAQRLLTISPLGVERLLQRMGVSIRRAGRPVRHEGQTIFACWIEIDAQTCEALSVAPAGPAGNRDRQPA